MKKRAFTLIELSLSILLFSILLTTLFLSYRGLKVMESEKEDPSFLEERYFDQRTAQIFRRLDEKGGFLGDETSFCFIFDQGAHTNPLLAGKVLAKLYFDPPTSTIALTYWPDPLTKQISPTVTLVLIENVKDVKCSFYFPPKSQKNGVDPEKVGPHPKRGWNTTWQKNYQAMPALIKMDITRTGEEKPTPFVFDLPPYKVRSDL
jgi:prepilin-type N-terminal cleavage/methylation domain-containing protein